MDNISKKKHKMKRRTKTSAQPKVMAKYISYIVYCIYTTEIQGKMTKGVEDQG